MHDLPRELTVSFPTNGEPPMVAMRKKLANGEEEEGAWTTFRYELISGATFMRKMDTLLAIFRK